ncbi:PTH2-domain-containing protein [Annulohypoxylon maeteangense]|uniref:PTH2-domain-containing protein n=1 Tax=Annulohypoxylon maeteangense TaxID=1927788 RepID=UPI002008AE38|nr:PTH2-domain-containing protein [Annulohypoxylon maeteangense]KAI0884748.1 PTH2-domain-containing protein [Annulohypoxylon maeteangense]
MADKPSSLLLTSTSMIVATSIVTFLSGFIFGVYSIRGYLLVSPSLASERRSNIDDPVESDESDIDDDTILDHAPNWANGEDADQRDGLKMPKQKKSKKKATKAENKEDKASASPRQPLADAPANEECKLVLVVRTDLGMTKGKIAAQCSHATLACYKTLTKAATRNPTSPEAKLLQRWERRGQAKIAVQVKSEDELLELMGKARSLGITAEVIQDAGRTQIDPGSLTVLGVGPAPKSLVDRVTGGLKLL